MKTAIRCAATDRTLMEDSTEELSVKLGDMVYFVTIKPMPLDRIVIDGPMAAIVTRVGADSLVSLTVFVPAEEPRPVAVVPPGRYRREGSTVGATSAADTHHKLLLARYECYWIHSWQLLGAEAAA